MNDGASHIVTNTRRTNLSLPREIVAEPLLQSSISQGLPGLLDGSIRHLLTINFFLYLASF